MPPHSPRDDLWVQYLAAEGRGDRRAALPVLSEFVAQLRAGPKRELAEWAASFCRRVLDEGEPMPLRHPLFIGVLVPFLKDGLKEKAPHTARWSAAVTQHLYSDQATWREFDFLTERDLLERALEHDPADVRASHRLLGVMWAQLRYASHEVPLGILHGPNGASFDECGQLLADLDRMGALAAAAGELEERRPQLDAWRALIEAYRDHLHARSEPTYRALLEKRGLLRHVHAEAATRLGPACVATSTRLASWRRST
jgi:hypothetical protein